LSLSIAKTVVLFITISILIVRFTEHRNVQANHYRFHDHQPENSLIENIKKAAEVKSDDSIVPWSPGDLMQPEELAQLISGEQKPIIFQTGVIHLFRISRIPGSKYVGQAGTNEGLEMLKKAAQDLPRSSEIIYYCGCCPWKDCPNIRPPYKALQAMGFKKIRVLNLPNNFIQDWIKKGFPVEKGAA
jgi:thiosulfate/3-mercaptopyruvate sulfurtransferase